MARALDEIGPAIDLVTRLSIRREGLSVHIKQLPKAEPPSDVVGEGELMRRRLMLHCRQGIEIGLKVDEILIGYALIRGVGKRRIEVRAIGSYSALHRVDEVE